MATQDSANTAPTSFIKNRRSSLIAAIFLMATSAIGPGFITQTATFTATMGAAFAFGILASIVIDFIVQQSIWRVITVTNMRASDIANKAIPGSGYFVSNLSYLRWLGF
ncbi:Mn2+ and Fe2+ transporters of the NRAMP family [Proteus vulgaris]|nr:Mn2+ and Fe2+ transporters of the NRAMP family [Proteus vulgaris]